MTTTAPQSQETTMPDRHLDPAEIATIEYHRGREVEGLGPVDAMRQALDRAGITDLLQANEDLRGEVAARDLRAIQAATVLAA